MTLLHDSTSISAPARREIAAQAVGATKIYGKGDGAVVALDHVDVSSPPAPSPPSWARPARASRP